MSQSSTTRFADQALATRVTVLANELIAKDTFRLRLQSEAMARLVCPGQFFMLRIAGCNDPLIGRALALFDRHFDSANQPAGIDVVYLVKGKFTKRLAQVHVGDSVEIWGPLGNGFSPTPVNHLIMVAGGIGQTPFLSLAREALGQQTFANATGRASAYASKVSFCYGVRSADYFAALDQFEDCGVQLHLATEDGSQGPPRRVTDLLETILQDRTNETRRVVCCGPEPMMEAVAAMSARYAVPCEVSLETPMACGIGICFTCVARVGTANDWDYKRTCVEGPVFDASSIQW